MNTVERVDSSAIRQATGGNFNSTAAGSGAENCTTESH